ncbi:energy-coupled thiamine transporter ThiT [Bacillus thuringiensis]|nr:energy-coupled thiamine transporter ThiT [Bacillus thuringiensis]
MQASNRILFLMEMAIFAALSLVLDVFSFKAWAQGGSISLQMIPIFLMAFRWGWKGGITTGLLVGLLQLVTGPYIIHPAQGLLDYPVAFTLVGFAAVTAKSVRKAAYENNQTKFIAFLFIGALIGSIGRLAAHFFSATIFFGAAAPAGQAIWIYSLIYNSSYVIPSFILSITIIIILFSARPKLILPKK